MGRMNKLTQDRLKEMLDYDPATGIFVWKAIGRGIRTGKRAGNVDPNGYRYIRIDGEDHLAQRLAWFWVNGVWPRLIRFQDLNRDNCAISNLTEGFYLDTKHDLSTKEGKAAYQAEYRAATPEKTRDKQLQHDFGITLATYNRMLDDQGGVCAICEKPEFAKRSGKIRALCVDHNHETGQVRALLCTGCNPMIGYSKDNPQILRKAAAYLERYEVSRVKETL